MKHKIFLIVFAFFSFMSFAQSSKPNGTILENSSKKGHTVLRRVHNQTLEIGDEAYSGQKIIYDSPVTKKECGTLQIGDEIKISELYILDSKEMWLKIQSSRGDGYILYEQASRDSVYDPYANDLWMPVETIKSGNQTWNTIKCFHSFMVYENLNIRDKPGMGGTKIGMIKPGMSGTLVRTSQITVEKETIDGKTDCWAKVTYENIEGWVFAGYLHIERGGPKYINPESSFDLSLGYGI